MQHTNYLLYLSICAVNPILICIFVDKNIGYGPAEPNKKTMFPICHCHHLSQYSTCTLTLDNMKKTILVSAMMAACAALHAQSPMEKGANSINEDAAKAHVYFLASDNLEGREVGTQSTRIAADYIIANLRMNGIRPLGSAYIHQEEAVRRSKKQKGRFQTHPDSLAVIKNQSIYQTLELNNVLGMIEGKNTDEYVIIGAHYDHEGMDPLLAGDKIYNGADDNASGVSAVLQIAKAFKESGQKPERNIIFAFWDGEESGLLGSSAFTYSYENIDKVKGYINFDMIGRTTYNQPETHVAYFYSEYRPEYEKWMKESIDKLDLALTPNYRPSKKDLGGSDNISFQRKDIPIIWYHTDGHADYNQPTDTADRINYKKLTDISKAAYYCMWKMANEK